MSSRSSSPANADQSENAEICSRVRLISYSAEELKRFREAEVARIWPSFLDEDFKNPRDNWDPDMWHQNRRRGDLPPEGGGADKDADHASKRENKEAKSAAGDKALRREVKDRLKVDQDLGFNLSPQRRSFNEGCHIGGDPKDNLKKMESNIEEAKRNQDEFANRRVGSGRLANNREDFDVRRYERYGYGRRINEEEELRRDREKRPAERWNRQYPEEHDNYDNRRRTNPPLMRNNAAMPGRNDRRGGSRYQSRNDEPEWMSASVEQGDMMELGGFDDSPEKERFAKQRAEVENGHNNGKKQENKKEEKKVENNTNNTKQDFNLDDFLRLESIPGLANILADDPAEIEAPSSNQSRFTKFFHKSEDDQRRSSIQDEIGLNGALQPKIHIPSPNSEAFYFAPISPAAKTSSRLQNAQNEPETTNPLMELIKGNQGSAPEGAFQRLLPGPPPTALNQLQSKGLNVKSVEGLEADLKQMVGLGTTNKENKVQQANEGNKDNSKKEELSAFNKFAAMIERGQTASSNPPVQMMNPPVNLGLVRPSPLPPHFGAPHLDPSASHRHPPPMLPHQPPDLLELIHCAPMNYEILQRPEAHALQHAVEKGDTNPQYLLVQFAHGNLGTFQREILLNVLKVQQNAGRLPTKVGSHLPKPGSSPLLEQRHQQQQQQHPTRLSPLFPYRGQGKGGNLSVSPTAGHQRIPSPQGLVLHTQQIVQNALIKRKLEEQKENFRRRQGDTKEDGKCDSPLPQVFAPTVVMKKLAAERRDSDPKPQIPELRISQMESNLPPHVIQQQQPRSSPNPIMMPPVPLPPPNPMFMMHQQQQQQQQQMLRMSSEGVAFGAPGPQGGLSRFFSPEVLAQAQSGNAPSMPTRPMTLEEIERQAAAAASVRI